MTSSARDLPDQAENLARLGAGYASAVLAGDSAMREHYELAYSSVAIVLGLSEVLKLITAKHSRLTGESVQEIGDRLFAEIVRAGT